MNDKENRVTCEQARLIDLVDYLSSLGYHPSRVSRDDYWYHSPLRNERTPSFKINRANNVWFDHGTGKGGNMLDFGLLYHQCSIKELLEKLSGNFSFHPQVSKDIVPADSLIKILSERPLFSLSLVRYLNKRRIAENVVQRHCREISFSLHDKTHNAIGFRNNEGGFELRNEWFKGSSSPKAITTLENGEKMLSVFEGFFDFLSYLTISQKLKLPGSDFLVLNSTSFFEKNRQVMEKYNSISLFLDRDVPGQKLTAQALSWNKKYSDQSSLYKGYNDLNEWTQQIGKSETKGLKP